MTIYSTCSTSESFYTAKQSIRRSDHATHKSPFISLNGSRYHLTVYHKKPDQSEWKEITNNCLDLLEDSNFQKMLQQIKRPCSEIEIQAFLHQNAISKNSIHCLVTENGNKRKVNLSVNKLLFAKVSQLFAHNIKGLTNGSVYTNSSAKTNTNADSIKIWLQDSVPYLKKKYEASFAKNLLKDTQKDSQMRTWLEEKSSHGQYWKELHKKCQKPNAKLNARDLQNFFDCLVDFSDFQILEKEELLQNIQRAMGEVKTVVKPVQVFGFKNTCMNCGFNACLQMILNEPALLAVYTTVANYYAKGKRQEQLCGKQMLSVLESYEHQKSASSEISHNLRLAMHFLSGGIISSKVDIQEDASEILTILFSKYEDILKEEKTVESLQKYLKDFEKRKSLPKIPVHLEPILKGKKITLDLLQNMIKDYRENGLNTLLSTSPMHYTVKRTTHHKIEKVVNCSNVNKEDYSILPENNTLTEETAEWNLKITFQPNSIFKLDTLLKSYFCNENVANSEPRKFIKNTELIKASIIKEELEFNKLPEHLFINFERFTSNITGKGFVKLNNPIDIPEILDACSLHANGHPNASYELRSFIVHLGTTLKSGHYVAYRKVENQWWKCNDHRVSRISQEEMFNALRNSYSCFYTLNS